MTTKLDIVNRILELTESDEVQKKLKNNYYYLKFMGLDFNMNSLKSSMAVNLNRFSKREYYNALLEIQNALV